MKRPCISVIIPVYNNVDLLERALNSVPLDKDVQLIVLDDGSTDGSWQLALKWWDEHVNDNWSIIHRWADNHGVAAAMNLGFNLADGEYIVSLSSDDYYKTDFEPFRPYLDGKNDLIKLCIDGETKTKTGNKPTFCFCGVSDYFQPPWACFGGEVDLRVSKMKNKKIYVSFGDEDVQFVCEKILVSC